MTDIFQKDLDPNRLREFLDSIPDDQYVDGFDSFFVGDEAETQMKKGQREVHDFQGMVHDDVGVEMEDDLDDFVPNIDECEKDEIEGIFINTKRSIFKKFNFIEAKSKKFKHPVKEIDLIFTEDDQYLVTHLENMVMYQPDVESIASLVSFRELGVLSAQFVGECGCPLCHAFNGKIFNVSESLEILCSGRSLVHKSCQCSWVPVFDRGKDYQFDVDEKCWETYSWFNIPREQAEELKAFPVERFVKFVDINKVIEKEKIDTFAGVPVVFRSSEGNLYVHNGYIDGLSPVDFLKKFVEEEKEFTEDQNADIFIYQGRKVCLKNGLYYDIKTGEVV